MIKNIGLENAFGEVYGYVRVSTKDQHEDRQMIAMEEYGVPTSHIFMDKQSGKDFNRPNYKRLIRIVRKGDIIVIKSIDRLGRNYQDIIDQWRMITQDIGCGIHVLDMPSLNTSGDPDDLISKFITDMMLQVLSFVAQNERENTIKRQQEGIAAAKRRARVKIGRPKIKIPFEFWEIYIIWKTGQAGTNDLSNYCKDRWDMSQRSFYRRIHEIDMRYGDIPPEKLRGLIVEDDFANGIAFDMERAEQALGIYNQYIADPYYARRQRQLKRKEREKNPPKGDKSEEEELKRIILEKRQQEFREKFNIKSDSTTPTEVKRGRGKKSDLSWKQQEALKMAEEAMSSNIKTVIID